MNIKDLKTFEDRYNYDVKKLGMVEKKGKFDYLSWAHAQKLAKIFDEKCTWRIIKNDNGSFVHNGFLLLEMTFLGQTEQHFFPILDNYNKPIQNPNPFQINTSQMRGFAKLFAMISGFGLSLYVGEDLAYLDEEKEKKEKCIKWIVDNISRIDEDKQESVLNNMDLLDLDKLNLSEIKIIYKKIASELKKGV